MEDSALIDQFLKILPRLIRENDTVKGAIITALSGVIATKEDIKELIREMDKRFEAVDKRFEAVDKRFKAIDKRFEAVDKRFEVLIRDMNKRFEAVDKRFDATDKHNDARFDQVMGALTSIQS